VKGNMPIINEKIYFIKTKGLNKSAFRKYLGVRRKTYMDNVMVRLFSYYYSNATSLKKEYRKYYKKEFATFEEFLSQKHNLTPNEIERLLENAYYKDLSIVPDYDIAELMNDDTISSAVLSFAKENVG